MPCTYCSTQFSNRQSAQFNIQSSTAVMVVLDSVGSSGNGDDSASETVELVLISSSTVSWATITGSVVTHVTKRGSRSWYCFKRFTWHVSCVSQESSLSSADGICVKCMESFLYLGRTCVAYSHLLPVIPEMPHWAHIRHDVVTTLYLHCLENEHFFLPTKVCFPVHLW